MNNTNDVDYISTMASTNDCKGVICNDPAHARHEFKYVETIARKYCPLPKVARNYPDGGVEYVHEKTAKTVKGMVQENTAAASAKEVDGPKESSKASQVADTAKNDAADDEDDDWVLESEGMVVPKVLEVKGGLQ